MDLWLRCILSAIAVWRVTHLVCYEEGPWMVLDRMRQSAGHGFWGRLLHCFYCLSVWIALPFAVVLPAGWGERVLGWAAFSGVAILLERHRPSLSVDIRE
jgi:hypothetical protein